MKKSSIFARALAILAAIALIVTSVYIPARADEDEYSMGLILPDDPGFIDPVLPPAPEPTPEPEPVDPCAGGHDMVFQMVERDSDCSNPGRTLYACSRCGYQEELDEPLPDSSKHVYGDQVVEKQPTCTEPGYTVIRCTICGIVLGEDWVPAATGHTRNGGTVTAKATCQHEGTIAYACTVCGADMGTESIPKTDHVSDGGSVVRKPTTTEPGEIEYRCTNCGIVLREEQIPVIPKRKIPQASFNTESCMISNIPDNSTVTLNGSVVTSSAYGTCSLKNMFPQTGDYTIRITANEHQGEAASDTQSILTHKPAAPSHIKTTAEPAKNGVGHIGGVDTNMEYTLADQDSWTTCTKSSQPVSAGIYYVRYKATTGSVASDSIEALVKKEKSEKKTKESTPNATFNGANLQIDGVQYCRISFDGGNNWTDKINDWTYVAKEGNLSTNCGIQIYRPGNGSTTTDSDKQYITITKQSMPYGISAISATAVAPGTILGVDNTMQYRDINQSTWNNITSTSIAVVPGTYYIRRMGYYNAIPSDVVTVVIKQEAIVNPTVIPTPIPTPKPTATPTPEPTAIPVEHLEEEKKAEEAEVVKEEATEGSSEEVVLIETEPTTPSGQKGWSEIEATFEAAEEPVVINLNEDTAIPAAVFEKAAETATELEILASANATWTIDPSNVNVTDVQELGRINLGIDENTSSIPSEALATVESASENQKVDHTFDIRHDGNFGFNARLTLKVATAEPGKYANLYWFNEAIKKMQYIDSAVVNEKKEATFNLSHASSYAVVVSDALMSQESVKEEAKAEIASEATGADNGNTAQTNSTTEQKTKKKSNSSVAVIIIILFVLLVGLAVVLIIMQKKKKEAERRAELTRHHRDLYK